MADVITRYLGPGPAPDAVLAGWPAGCPLVSLWSGGRGTGWTAHARWTVLGLSGEVTETTDASVALAWFDVEPLVPEVEGAPDGWSRDDFPPFCGGRVVALSYDTGEVMDRLWTGSGRLGDRTGRQDGACGGVWPSLMCRVGAAYVHDRLRGVWWVVGERGSVSELPALEGAGGAVAYAEDARVLVRGSDTGRERYCAAVERVLGHIAGGDVYQVNLAHQLTGLVQGSARAFFARAVAASGAWMGAYLETPERVVVSASPEQYLMYRPEDREVRSRPMKGTRPLSAGAASLEGDPKDRAELTMIVDLVRNDLGRVCEGGSVRVSEPRVIESHGAGIGEEAGREIHGGEGLLQGVSTVRGVLRSGVKVSEAVRATFPPGSVTGAPKLSAMALIRALEAQPRGVYCGAVGTVSKCGRVNLNVAIRSAALERSGSVREGRAASWSLRYGVGAGIVADSDPGREWQETLDKAGWLLRLAGVGREETEGWR
jgi:anthranilate/para-aminobenzoate synthase component I